MAHSRRGPWRHPRSDPPFDRPRGLARPPLLRGGRLASTVEPPLPRPRRVETRDGRRRAAGDEARSVPPDRVRDPGQGRLARSGRAGDRPRGRQAPTDGAGQGRARSRETAGPLLGSLRAGRRHVPRDAPQRRRGPVVLGLRGAAPRQGREGPRRAGARGREDLPRRRASVRRSLPCARGRRMNLPDRTVLGNGAVLVSASLPSNPFVAFRGSIPAGVAAEGESHGVAEFTSRLLLSGTRHRTAAKLADRLEGIGATLEFHNGDEVLSFSGRSTRNTARETVRILVECLSEPTVPEREIERVRGELLHDLRIEADDTHLRAMRELERFVFPNDHPYGRDPKGGADRVRRIRRRDLVAFHEAHVNPEALILAVTGDVDRRLMEDAIAEPLSRLDTSSEGVPAIPPPRPHKPRRPSLPMPHKSQSDIIVGGPAAPRRHDDYYALNLANLLFGRIGLYGRLGRNLRDEQGLAYYAFASLDAKTAGGMWSLAAGANPANLSKATRSIREELDRLQTDPFHSDEVRDGKDNQVGSLIVSLERNAEVASELHRMEYYGLGIAFLERYPEVIGDLTGERVRDVARKYFLPSASSMVIAGPVGRARFRL